MLTPTGPITPLMPPGLEESIRNLGTQIESLGSQQAEIAELAGLADVTPTHQPWMEIFNGYAAILVVAFLVTLVATPILRKLAISNGVIDRPDARKVHRMPIAYLGGVAVYLGIMAGIFVSYLGVRFPLIVSFHEMPQALVTDAGHPFLVPPSILMGLTIIMLIGLIDDVTGVPPRVKIGGQLLAAAALAYSDVGVKVAQGVLSPTLGALLDNRDLIYHFNLPVEIPIVGSAITFDAIYWTGTAVIAIFLLGATNASNLIDGLDGLLSGVTVICCAGLLIVALMITQTDPGPRDSQRIVLCLAVLGGCLGFLPHNFNPAVIFLGDAGSLLLGFATIVIILTLGDTGRTDLVIAGLFIYGVPILDTALAIIRRKMAGKKMSEPDSDHLHHMLKRPLGVKGAVLVLYGIGAGFAVLGVLMAASGARFIYTLALLFTAFIGVYSIKIARRKQLEAVIIDTEPTDPATIAKARAEAAAQAEQRETAGV